MLAVAGDVSTLPADLAQSLTTNTNCNHGDVDQVSIEDEIPEPYKEPADIGTVGEVTKEAEGHMYERRDDKDAIEKIQENEMEKKQC